jgi:hypothetical protein
VAQRDLIDAIERRVSVRLRYAKDRGRGERVCQPHVLYVGSTGRLVLDAVQVAGYSSSGDLPQWRMFEVAAIERVEVLDRRFRPAPDCNPGNRARFVRIIATCCDEQDGE